MIDEAAFLNCIAVLFIIKNYFFFLSTCIECNGLHIAGVRIALTIASGTPLVSTVMPTKYIIELPAIDAYCLPKNSQIPHITPIVLIALPNAALTAYERFFFVGNEFSILL